MVDAAESGSERVGLGADLACLLSIFRSSETCSVPDLHHDTGKIQDLSCPQCVAWRQLHSTHTVSGD